MKKKSFPKKMTKKRANAMNTDEVLALKTKEFDEWLDMVIPKRKH